MSRYSRQAKIEPTAAQLHAAAFDKYPEFKEMALLACNAWTQGRGTAQSCMLLALSSLWEISMQESPSLEDFETVFNERITALGAAPLKPVVPAPDETDVESEEIVEEPTETFAQEMARRAADARAAMAAKKRRRK